MPREFAAAVVMTLIIAFFAFQLDGPQDEQSLLVPQFLLCLMAACNAGQYVLAFLRNRQKIDTILTLKGYPLKRVGILCLLTVLYIGVLEIAGFYLSSFIYMIVVSLIAQPMQGHPCRRRQAGARVLRLHRFPLSSVHRCADGPDPQGIHAVLTARHTELQSATKEYGMNRFFLRILSVLALLLPLTAHAAPVDEYPNGPITAVCTYSVGSQTDVQARICAMPAEKYFGQPIVILNKAGAGGLTGWNWFMDRGSRDGLTMTVYNLPNFIAQSIVKKNAKYSIRTLEPLANFAADPVVLFVSKDSPFNSVSDLVEFARKNPGKVTLNGSGLFVGHHIALLLLAKEADIKLTYVPEKGGSDSLQSVMAGKVMGSFNNLSIAMRALDKIKVLGIADLQRHEFIPDVPTFIEQGYKTLDDATTNFRGYALPVGVDKAIVEKAAQQAYKMFNDPLVIENLKKTGVPYRILDRQAMLDIFAKREAILKDLLKPFVEE